MTRKLSVPALLMAVALVGAKCSSATDAGDPEGNLDVEFLNFTSLPATMGRTGGPTVVVAGNPTSGNSTIYKVVNPGIGNSIQFSATWNSTTMSVLCTVTDITGISVPPGVVIQPQGFLDCSGW
jgi:hypothetical protein